MSEVGIYEAKTKLAELLKKVKKGELVTITNRGVPVADLVPSASRVAQQTLDAIEALKAMQKPNAIDEKQYNEMRQRGRR